MTLQSSGEPLGAGPLSLVILHTNQKSIVVQYRDRVPRQERGRTVDQTVAAQIL